MKQPDRLRISTVGGKWYVFGVRDGFKGPEHTYLADFRIFELAVAFASGFVFRWSRVA